MLPNFKLHLAAISGNVTEARRLIAREKKAAASAASSPPEWFEYKWDPLHCAADAGNREMCELLITERPSPSHVDYLDTIDRTPLMLAAGKGYLDVCELLLSKGANVSLVSKYGKYSALWFAFNAGHSKVCELLIRAGSDTSKLSLGYAAAMGSIELCEMMFNNGLVRGGVNEKSLRVIVIDSGQTALHEACIEGHLVVCKYLCNVRGADVNITDSNGETPLHVAAYHKQTAICEFLIKEQKVNVNAINGYKRTPLHEACSRKRTSDIVRLLLDNGADANLIDDEKKTPLHYACEKLEIETVTLLIEKGGCDVNQRGTWREVTPLAIVITSTTPDANKKGLIVSLLLKHGARFNEPAFLSSPTRFPNTLCYAAYHGCDSICRELLSLDANVDSVSRATCLAASSGSINVLQVIHDLDQVGWYESIVNCVVDCATPLLYAIDERKESVCEFLIQHGANPNIRSTHSGYSPLHVAVDFGMVNVCKLLLDHGAEVNLSRANCDLTPMDIAIKNFGDKEESEIINLLESYDGRPSSSSPEDEKRKAVKKRRMDLLQLMAASDEEDEDDGEENGNGTEKIVVGIKRQREE